MDGTPDIDATSTRRGPGPSGLPPTTRVPTIKDPLVLYQKGFISKAQLKAETSKSREDADAAHKEVCALVGWIDPKTPPIPTGKKNSPIVKYSEEQAEKALIKKYEKENYQFISSKTSTDSLISSLLKLFSNDLQTDHQPTVKTYRDKLNALRKNQKRTVLTEKDSVKDEHIHDIVEEMKKDKSLLLRERAVEIWRANDQGEVVKFCIGSGTEKVILFQRKNEFTAVIPRQKQTSIDTLTGVDDDDPSGPGISMRQINGSSNDSHIENDDDNF